MRMTFVSRSQKSRYLRLVFKRPSVLRVCKQALEPHISKEIMTLHHKKHHQTYVNGLNAAEESLAKAASPSELIALQPAIKFNGGGEPLSPFPYTRRESC